MARRHHEQTLDLGSWFMVGIFVACHGAGLPLSVANGNFQRRPGFTLALLLAFTAFMVVGAVIVPAGPATPSAGSSRPSAC